MFPNVLQQEIINFLDILEDENVLQCQKFTQNISKETAALRKNIWLKKNSNREIKVGLNIKTWSTNGRRHREDGPAEISNGNLYWYKNGDLHRLDGPAIIYTDGTQYWYINGKLHKENGPAIIYAGDGFSPKLEWYKKEDGYWEQRYK